MSAQQLDLLKDPRCRGVWKPPYRYLYEKWWTEDGARVLYIMLNPSDGTPHKPDPTMRQCIGFAQSHGFGGLEIVNLYGLLTSKPTELKKTARSNLQHAIGPENSTYVREAIVRIAKRAEEERLRDGSSRSRVVLAWGAQASKTRGGEEQVSGVRVVVASLNEITALCFGQNKDRSPIHPLMLPGDTRMVPYLW